MFVRPAKPSDLPAATELGHRMYSESRFSRYPFDLAGSQEFLRSILSDSMGSCFFVAESSSGQLNGIFIGQISTLFFSSAVVAYDKLLYVSPEARGSSAALRLLMAFRRWAEDRGAAEISVNMTVAIDIERFQRFMGHLGFQFCGGNYWMPVAGKIA